MSDEILKPIVGTLGYILSKDRKSVLMVHRITRSDDDNLGKFNGVGGKLESGESVAECMIREIREETDLEVTHMTLRGTLCWADFGPKKQDWLGFVFLVDGFKGVARTENEEGPLRWIPLKDFPNLPMWKGDTLFLPLVFDSDPRPFHGFMRYDGEEPKDWRFSRF